MDAKSLALLYKNLSEITGEDWSIIEERKAERAHRLASLLQSEVWRLDLYPILRKLHDDYLDSVKKKELDPDVLKVFDEILNQIDGSIRIGAGAMERLAARRAKAAIIANRMKQQQAPTSLAS